MRVITTPIADVVAFESDRHVDSRGFVAETFRHEWLAARGVDFVIRQENLSRTALAGTVRGLHFQTAPNAQGKLVRVLRGAIFDVAVDLRPASPTYGKHYAMRLDEEHVAQLWIPPGFAHGFCTLAPDTEVLYKLTAAYAPQSERGIAWNDPALGIDWPVLRDGALVSDKDLKHPCLADAPPFEM